MSCTRIKLLQTRETEKVVREHWGKDRSSVGSGRRKVSRLADSRDPHVWSRSGKDWKRRFFPDWEDPESQTMECDPILSPFRNAIKCISEKTVAKRSDRVTPEGMQKNTKSDGSQSSLQLGPLPSPILSVSRGAGKRPLAHGEMKAPYSRAADCLQANSGQRVEPFRSDVWKLLRLHLGSGNKVLRT